MKTLRLSLITLFIFSFTLTCSAAEYSTFDAFYSPSLSIGVFGWTLIALSVVAGALAVYFSGGTAAGPVATAIGTWIGEMAGLSGAAATSYGLALLGGGAMTAGGLGIAGGAALITATLTFGTEVVTGYGFEKVHSSYESKRFIEDSKTLLTLPPPRVMNGSQAYTASLNQLKNGLHLDANKPIALTAPENQAQLRSALTIAEAIGGAQNAEETCQLEALKALLQFQLNNYDAAKIAANKSIVLARSIDRRRTLPAFIYAVSSLYEEQPEVDRILFDYFRYSILAEPKNKLIPVLYAVFLDRAMYRYNDGVWTIKHLGCLIDIACEKTIDDVSPECLAIVTARILIQVKKEQQSIYGIARTKSETLLKDTGTKCFLAGRLESYIGLLKFMKTRVMGELDARRDRIPTSLGISLVSVRSLVNQYEADIPYLRAAIDGFKPVNPREGRTVLWILIACSVGCFVWLVARLQRARTI